MSSLYVLEYAASPKGRVDIIDKDKHLYKLHFNDRGRLCIVSEPRAPLAIKEPLPGSAVQEERDIFAMSFLVFALTDPRARALIDSNAPVGAILGLYKDRPYIDEDPSKQQIYDPS